MPGRVNVSDCATRSRFDERSELIPARWLTGPDFLYQDEDNWPKEIRVEDLKQHEEIKPSKIFVAKSDPERVPAYADVDLEQISSLWKAQRVAAQVRRFFNICKGKKPVYQIVWHTPLYKSNRFTHCFKRIIYYKTNTQNPLTSQHFFASPTLLLSYTWSTSGFVLIPSIGSVNLLPVLLNLLQVRSPSPKN